MLKTSFFIFVLSLFSIPILAKTTVHGKVTGADGNLILVAHVFLTFPSDNQPIESVAVSKDGSYKINIGSPGLWMLHFIGTFHHEYPVAIYCNKEGNIQLNVKLEMYHYYINKSENPKIVGNFNNWSTPRAEPLKKNKDGTFSTVITSKLDTLFYRLVNVRTGGEVEGTDADGVVPYGVKGYNSFLLAKGGKVKVVFNPQKLVYSNQHASFSLYSANSVQLGIAKAYATLVDAKHRYESSFFTNVAHHKFFGFRFNFSPYINRVKKLLGKEPSGLVRQALLLSYFQLSYIERHGNFVKVTTARQALNDIPYSSIIWSLNPHSILDALGFSAYTMAQKDEYIKNVLRTNPMKRTKEILLDDVIDWKFHTLYYKAILPYLSILLDQYGNSPEALKDKKIYAWKYVHLKSGDIAPHFSLKSSFDSTHTFTNNSFKGKYYLLEFWATWSKESKKELMYIKNAYERYKNRNFDIISVSLDSSLHDVSKHRLVALGVHWPNVNVLDGFDAKICKDYEVYSVPKAILVDPKGKILSTGWGLRGKGLDNNLAKCFEK